MSRLGSAVWIMLVAETSVRLFRPSFLATKTLQERNLSSAFGVSFTVFLIMTGVT